MIDIREQIIYFLVILFSFFLSSITWLFIFRKIVVTKLIVIGITMFVNVYIICSFFLFAFDIFAVWKSLVLSLIFQVIITVIAFWNYIKNKGRLIVEVDLKEFLIIFSFILILFPLICQRNGYFCMGQDEGVYFMRALYLVNDNNANIHAVDEYDNILDDDYKDFYKDSLRYYVMGFSDPLEDLNYIEANHGIKKEYTKYKQGLYGRFGGTPAFPALLALFGKVAGGYNMGYVQIIFYYLYIILFYYTLKNLKIRTILSVMISLGCGVVPNTIWCGKSYLTEMYIAVLMLGMILFLTEKNIKLKVLALLYFGTVCFYHITAYVFIPLIIAIYFYLFMREKNRYYLVGVFGIVFLYYIGICLFLKINPAYTIRNYGHLSFTVFTDADSMWQVITFICIVIVLSVLLLVFNCKVQKLFWLIWDKYIQKKFVFILKCCSIFLVLGNFVVIFKSENWQTNTLIAYFCLSGGYVMFFAYLYWIGTWKTLLPNGNYCIVAMCFLYMIILLSLFNNNTNCYYYYARYLQPYMSFIFLFAAIVFNESKSKIWLNLFFCFLSIIYMLVYDTVLIKYQDDTYYQTSTLNQLESCIEEGDITIVEEVNFQRFGALYPLIHLKNAFLYPMKENIDETIECILHKKERYIFITNHMVEDENFQLVNTIENKISILSDYKGIYTEMFLHRYLSIFLNNDVETIYVYKYYYGGKQ